MVPVGCETSSTSAVPAIGRQVTASLHDPPSSGVWTVMSTGGDASVKVSSMSIATGHLYLVAFTSAKPISGSSDSVLNLRI